MVARDFSGATFTAALRHKDAAYAVALAESLLSDAPLDEPRCRRIAALKLTRPTTTKER